MPAPSGGYTFGIDEETRHCPACGARAAPTATFCSDCGSRLDGASEPVAYATSSPQLFGVLSPVATFVLGCLLLVAGLGAFLASSRVVGIVLLAVAAAVFVLFYGAAERDSSSRLARGAIAARDRIRGWTGFAGRSVGAWTAAGRDVARLRRELKGLRTERERVQLELGDAAYREDESALVTLRDRMRELDGEIGTREEERAASVARARRRVTDERVAIHPTEVVTPGEAEAAKRDAAP